MIPYPSIDDMIEWVGTKMDELGGGSDLRDLLMLEAIEEQLYRIKDLEQ